MAAYIRAPQVSVRATLAGRADARCLDTLRDFWSIGMPSAMKRLFMDSDGQAVFSPSLPHACTYTLNRPDGTFASIARGRCLRTVDQARKCMGQFRSRWMRGGWTPQFSVALNNVARCEPATTERNAPQVGRLGPRPLQSLNVFLGDVFCGKPIFYRGLRFIHKVLRFCEDGCLYPSGPRQQGLLIRERPVRRQGDPWPLAPNQGPWASAAEWTVLT